jgi:hypothetical protein
VAIIDSPALAVSGLSLGNTHGHIGYIMNFPNQLRARLVDTIMSTPIEIFIRAGKINFSHSETIVFSHHFGDNEIYCVGVSQINTYTDSKKIHY